MARVLIVEDDAGERELYLAELGRAGHEVICAREGREALTKADAWSPDVVVMDISMPGMDGIDAMNRLLAQNNKLPIIINTAYASYKDDFRAWAADAYVVKSADLAELKGTITRVLESRKREQEAGV